MALPFLRPSHRLPAAALCAALLLPQLTACTRPASETLLADAQQYRQKGEARGAII